MIIAMTLATALGVAWVDSGKEADWERQGYKEVCSGINTEGSTHTTVTLGNIHSETVAPAYVSHCWKESYPKQDTTKPSPIDSQGRRW